MPTLYQRITEMSDTEIAISLLHYLESDISTDGKTKKVLLSEISDLIDATIRGDIITDAVDIAVPAARIDNVITVNGTDRSIAASDGSSIIVYVTTGAADRTITILTESLIAGVKIKIVKVDTGSGHVVVATEGAEKIYNQYVDFDTIAIWLRFSFIEVESDGTQWIKINSPYVHMLDEVNRTNAAFDLDVDPSTAWAEADLSALVPNGTLGLWGYMKIRATDTVGSIMVRDASSIETDTNALTTANMGPAGNQGSFPTIIKATNGIFDYKEIDATTEIATFIFHVWGWLL